MDCNEIIPNLYMGAQPSNQNDTALFDAIVNLSGGFVAGDKPTLLWIIDDGPLPDLSILYGVGKLISFWVLAGRKVLVHCGAGINRSGLVTGVALLSLGYDGSGAVTQIQSKRPGALQNRVFKDYLNSKGKD
jgi:protein-tyrosine phosphatase